jgi:hypothetical protein
MLAIRYSKICLDRLLCESERFLVYLLDSISIVGDGAGGALDITPNSGTGGVGELLHTVRDVGGGRQALEAHQVRGEAGDVG